MFRIILLGSVIAAGTPALAQEMDHSGHSMAAMTNEGTPAPWQQGSGTSRVPGNEPMTGAHIMTGDWMLMAHGYAWGVYSDQGGPRGDEKAFVQSMAMVSASRPLGDSVGLQLRAMASLDPLMGQRGYPILFASGETAHGEGLVDRQHPHDFLMELSARLDFDLGGTASAFLYGGLPGEPAIGPAAFMHRGSARFNPEAPVTHHWFDSTHITFGVVTAGIATDRWQLEASAFNGTEPDEERWGIDTPRLNSWALRATWTPTSRWSAQISYAGIKEPEALHPGQDTGRLTASLSYADSRFSATAAYARKNLRPGPVLDAWLAEANWRVTGRHNLFTRLERVENNELFDHHSPLHDAVITVNKLSLGYAWQLPLGGEWNLALGGLVSAYDKPQRIDFAYGDDPKSFMLFAKLSLGD
jgi:hypothetical protein